MLSVGCIPPSRTRSMNDEINSTPSSDSSSAMTGLESLFPFAKILHAGDQVFGRTLPHQRWRGHSPFLLGGRFCFQLMTNRSQVSHRGLAASRRPHQQHARLIHGRDQLRNLFVPMPGGKRFSFALLLEHRIGNHRKGSASGRDRIEPAVPSIALAPTSVHFAPAVSLPPNPGK